MRDRHNWQEITSKPYSINYSKAQQIGQVLVRQFFGLGIVIVAIAIGWFLTLGAVQAQSAQPQPAQAQSTQPQSVEDLKNYQNFVDQQRQIIQKQQEQINALTKPAQSRLEALRRNVRVTDTQIKDNEKKIRLAKEQLQKLSTKLQELEYDLNKRREATQARLRYLQRQQLQRWWVTLLSSQDLNQFADRRRQIERIYNRDRKLLADLTQKSNQVEKQHNQITAQNNEVEDLRAIAKPYH
jgi:peptidoglycan hydrolase CwlO-like protein